MKAYAINFNPLILATHELLSHLDTKWEVKNWYTPFPGTVLIATDESPRSVTMMVAQRFPSQQFLVSETNYTNSDGQMPNVAWNFINHPYSSGRWDGALGALASSYSSNPLTEALSGLSPVNKLLNR